MRKHEVIELILSDKLVHDFSPELEKRIRFWCGIPSVTPKSSAITASVSKLVYLRQMIEEGKCKYKMELFSLYRNELLSLMLLWEVE